MLKIGDQVKLASHGYPNYYPSNAYVHWSFQYSSGRTSHDTAAYRITFKNISLGYGDNLTIGINSTRVALYDSYYRGRPDDLILEAGNLFVIFNTNSYYEDFGFQLEILVQYMTGMYLIILHLVKKHKPDD